MVEKGLRQKTIKKHSMLHSGKIKKKKQKKQQASWICWLLFIYSLIMDSKRPRNLEYRLSIIYTVILGTNTPTSIRLDYLKWNQVGHIFWSRYLKKLIIKNIYSPLELYKRNWEATAVLTVICSTSLVKKAGKAESANVGETFCILKPDLVFLVITGIKNKLP